jgi:hypothetical protein
VIVLASMDTSSIRSEQEILSPALRKIVTTCSAPFDDGVAFLEAPNIVQGFEAALLAQVSGHSLTHSLTHSISH